MRRLMGTGLVGLLVATAMPAAAFSLAEMSAASGVQSTLAGTGASSAHAALTTVQRNIPAMTATPNYLSAAGEPTRASGSSGSSSGGTNGWATPSSGGASGKGWATAHSSGSATGKGWLTADSRGAGSPTAKPWATAGSSGGSGHGWTQGGSASTGHTAPPPAHH